tara:strand:- start:2719 stop:3435 length:717 start_codon:yes stop_codon:yes gene_type:complete
MDMKIEFIARDKYWSEIQPYPKPARSVMPEWYSEAPLYYSFGSKDDRLKMTDEGKNMTFKKCIPLIDGLKSGYIVELRKDLIVQDNQDGQFDIQWNSDDLVITVHNSASNLVEAPYGYNTQVINYIWNTIIKTPKGYSCLITHPLGFNDTALRMIPAVVDSDKEVLNFHLPMWLKKDFIGIIKKGTPIAQIIPFKRDNWTAKNSFLKEGEYEVLAENGFNATMQNHYRDTSWSKKRFK